ERAALRFGFAAGQVPNAVTEEHFAELRKHFSEKQIVDLGATIALFGFLNRWNDTMGTALEPEAVAFAEKHLVKSGWEIGKHK
ncbi:MAG: carboxymuconolactone decarboxylase family protein, partial [Saprospiraceae bacterium]